MVASQRGDDEAYGLLMGEVRAWLIGYFRRRLGPVAADDAAQETLLAIHLRKDGYRDIGPFVPWLCTIARFKWMDQLRLQYRDADLCDTVEVAVESHATRSLAAILVECALNDLKPPQADAIRLVKLSGASVEEAAMRTGQSPSLIKVNIHRGIRRIASRFAEVGPAGDIT